VCGLRVLRTLRPQSGRAPFNDPARDGRFCPLLGPGACSPWGKEDTTMTANFRVVALPRETFLPLFELDDEALREQGIRRSVVTESPGTPCRVSLEDALPGERVLLLPFVHHDVASPYRASGP